MNILLLKNREDYQPLDTALMEEIMVEKNNNSFIEKLVTIFFNTLKSVVSIFKINNLPGSKGKGKKQSANQEAPFIGYMCQHDQRQIIVTKLPNTAPEASTRASFTTKEEKRASNSQDKARV
jgi:hypothetical protein